MSPTEVKLSPTIAIGTRAAELASQGIDVISLSAGEPDFPTPADACEAGIQAIRDGFTKYTPNNGTLELRKAIAAKLKNDNGLGYAPDEILVSNGAKQAFFNLLWALVSPGEEVLIPRPYWVSYPDMAGLIGAVPKYIPTPKEKGFRLTLEALEAAWTPKAKVLILNSPCNPTGVVYSQKELDSFASFLTEKKIWAVSDEIYEKIAYNSNAGSSIARSPRMKEQTIVVNGFSKAYAMTGWRLGYAAGPREVIQKASAIQSHITTNACSISQKAGVGALKGDQKSMAEMAKEFKARRDFLVEALKRVPQLSFPIPEGAFYLWIDVSAYLGGRVADSIELCCYLLEKYNVALVPGEAFGAPGYVRLAYAIQKGRLEEGVRRIAAGLSELKG
ncbi:MAG: pyridoxal phosphate-dependent aminotransferase [candidate division Zixibacteria bacterium]|nr:pyridoxal phosphate-dependent aminotransferase [candidate division Zixibacteria bacterium]